MRILFLTKYSYSGASSRYCYYNYLNMFEQNNYYCTVAPFFDDDYLECKNTLIKNIKVFFSIWNRIKILFKLSKYDLIVLEYEFIPFFFSIVENGISFMGIKYIVGYDDAIFHNYDLNKNIIVRLLLKNKIKNVIKYSQGVITGSPYLTAYAEKINKNVWEIPTSIDVDKYSSKYSNSALNKKFVIGWIGSNTTSKYVLTILPALKKFSQQHECEIRLIGFDFNLRFYFEGMPVVFIDWEEATEILEINKITVGIMPLTNDQWSMGKCGFKLIQYMACGKPTISTPLDANLKINRNGKNLHANDDVSWYNSLTEIYLRREFFEKVGEENRIIVAKNYSIQANYTKYLDIFETVISNQS